MSSLHKIVIKNLPKIKCPILQSYHQIPQAIIMVEESNLWKLKCIVDQLAPYVIYIFVFFYELVGYDYFVNIICWTDFEYNEVV